MYKLSAAVHTATHGRIVGTFQVHLCPPSVRCILYYALCIVHCILRQMIPKPCKKTSKLTPEPSKRYPNDHFCFPKAPFGRPMWSNQNKIRKLASNKHPRGPPKCHRNHKNKKKHLQEANFEKHAKHVPNANQTAPR